MNGQLLNILSGLIALSLQVREAHWNIRGPRFISVHTFFGAYYDAVDGFIDQVAERIAQLGGGPTVSHGDVQFVGRDINGALRAVEESSKRLRDTTSETVTAAMKAEDHGTADLLTRLGEMLDKNLWFMAAERGESPR